MAATRAESAWLDVVRGLILRAQWPAAQAALDQAMAEFPASTELRRVQAGVFRQTGRHAAAEASLRGLLAHAAGDAATAFALAHLLQDDARPAAAGAVLRACFGVAANARDADLAIAAIELLDDCDRKHDAADIAAAALVQNPDEARLHAYAGMLALQLGQFGRARSHYATALAHDARAWEWHAPIGLSAAQRYADAAHPDFTRFREGLQRTDLSDLARAELEFALGKAHDDIGACAQAARHFRAGNTPRHRLSRWSRAAWQHDAAARLAATAMQHTADATPGFAPVFIVGMPRSGTTLLAQLLARHPQVCNRGEQPWLARLAADAALAGSPERAMLQHAANRYATRTRRDDAGDARWFIDKQPLNFRYVDLMLALFPDARIIHCRRGARDTALSLWMQCFLEEVQGYAYDFDDIALVMRDCAALMAHWCRRYPDAIRAIHYEELVADADGVIEELAQWIGLPVHTSAEAAPASAGESTVSTASLWQARQPVTARSVGKWRRYVECLPELAQFPA